MIKTKKKQKNSSEVTIYWAVTRRWPATVTGLEKLRQEILTENEGVVIPMAIHWLG
jgi:hypothetical protein